MPRDVEYQSRGGWRGNFLRSFLVATMATALILVTLLLVLLQVQRNSMDYESYRILSTFLAVIFVASYFALLAWMIYLLLRPKHYRARFAVTGQPRSGKTVFTLLLYAALSSQDGTGPRFTGTTENILAVRRLLQGVGRGMWPRSTKKGAVSMFTGEIIFARRHDTAKIQIGDSAGEYWADLEGGRDVEEDYLAYVATTDALVHTIPLDAGGNLDEFVQRELIDLKFAAGLIASVQDRPRKPRILIVFTKADMIPGLNGDSLFRVVTHENWCGADLTSDLEWASQMDHLVAKLDDGLKGRFSDVKFCSSSATIFPTGPDSPELLRWVLDVAVKG